MDGSEQTTDNSKHKVVTTMVIMPLDEPTRCAQSVVADLRPFGLGYVEVWDEPAHVFLLGPH